MSELLDRRPYTFDRVVRILFSVCIIIAVIFFMNLLKGVLLPFIVACLIAYMLEPIVEWNMKILHTHRRFLPVIMTLIEVMALITVACMIFIPYIITEITDMVELLRKYATSQIDIPYISNNIHRFIKQNIDINYISNLLSREQWVALIKSTVSNSWRFLSSGLAVVLGFISWLIVILYVIFIMIDYKRLTMGFKQLVPQSHRHRVFRIFNDVKSAMNCYFRGQFLIAFLVGVLFSIGFLIVKLPMAVAFGMFIGLLNLVPYLQLISLPIAALLCIVGYVDTGVDFWLIFWETMAVYIVVQLIQDLILTPKIMGKAMGLNPAIILLSLSIWGSLLGIMGMIIALPLTTLILSYYDRYIVQRVQEKAYRRSVAKKSRRANIPE